MFAYVGGYTAADRKGRGNGINVYQVEPDGPWTHLQTVESFDNPSLLRISPDGRTLCAMHGGRSAASAYAADATTGHLTFVNRAETEGVNPVDFAWSADGRHIVIAHYTSGTVSVLPLDADGRLGAVAQALTLSGTPGPHPTEQKGPLPHGVAPDPTGTFMVIPDKGLDTVFTFRLDGDTLAKVASVATTAGAGPRHAAFHPTLPMLYVINELDCSVAAYRWNAGILTPVQSLSAIPSDSTTSGTGAEIAVSATGANVYASVRGHDCIARFTVDAQTGLLTLADSTSVMGHEPRFFALDPGGRHLHVANQASDTVVSFPLDDTGKLGDGVVSAEVGTPTVICFLP